MKKLIKKLESNIEELKELEADYEGKEDVMALSLGEIKEHILSKFREEFEVILNQAKKIKTAEKKVKKPRKKKGDGKKC